MGDIASVEIRKGVALLAIDSPPVNALGFEVRAALSRALDMALADDGIRAIVIVCRGRTFFAGADISEFGRPRRLPDLPAIIDRLDHAGKPVVAAIHGTALGGGCEIALACGWRVAVPSARLGLPEVNLGVLPGAGGTQRLPRLIGVEAALEMMTSGRPVAAGKALEMGLIDAIVAEAAMEEEAVAFARSRIGAPPRPVSQRAAPIVPPGFFESYRQLNPRLFRGAKAPAAIVEAVEAAVTLPFVEGLKRERALFLGLEASRESAAQRHLFFAERATGKVPGLPQNGAALPIGRVGVIGAGTMGGGIAMNFLNAGIRVTLVETSEEALRRGVDVIRRNYSDSVRKGRLTAMEVEQRMALLEPALDMTAVAAVDLVIEAVFEQMELKKEIFAKLDHICRDGAILASNTSFLDLDAIAAATGRPEYVVGLHFFSPANVMRLVEVVRGARTAPDVLLTAMKLAKTIGKVPVLSGVCHGFIANRVMQWRSKEAEALVLEGPAPQRIDHAIEAFGFAMGPFRMADLVGLDVTTRGSTERSLRGDLVARGRLGQKSGGGFYEYDEKRRPTPSADAAAIIATLARDRGVAPGEPMDDAAIVARLLFPVVNEGARVLQEKIALRASDIDVACALGYNWPLHTGGPMFWADTIGLDVIVATLDRYSATGGDAYRPAELLRQLAAEGGKLAEVAV